MTDNATPMPGTAELLPCPFCGGEATVSSERCGWRVDCIERDCYTRGPWPDDCLFPLAPYPGAKLPDLPGRWAL